MTKRIPYCVAPWMNSHVTAHGERSVCCATTKYHPYVKLVDWWQSPELRELRLQMLDHKPPMDTCSSCINNSRGNALNLGMNKRFPDILATADDLTDENGYTPLMPVEFEVKHILCNLKCRHCYDRSSSSIRGSLIKIDASKVLPLGPIYKKDLTLSEEVDDIEWFSKNSKHICWTGGEAFMSPLMVPGLQKLIDDEAFDSKQVLFTNGMFSQEKILKAVELLQQFNDLCLIVSIDGMHEIGEFSRTVWQHDKFVENVAFLQSQFPNAHFGANFVLHAVSILGMSDTMQFCLENNIKFQGQLIEDPIDSYLDYNLIKPIIYEYEFKRCKDLLTIYKKPNWIEGLESAFYAHYNPRSWTSADDDSLAFACKIRGQEGIYQKLTKGKINE